MTHRSARHLDTKPYTSHLLHLLDNKMDGGTNQNVRRTAIGNKNQPSKKKTSWKRYLHRKDVQCALSCCQCFLVLPLFIFIIQLIGLINSVRDIKNEFVINEVVLENFKTSCFVGCLMESVIFSIPLCLMTLL